MMNFGEGASQTVEFAAPNREQRGKGKPETFTFLGFSHYCGKRRKDGAFIVWRETAKKRLVAKLQAIKTELKRRRHEPIASVGAWLQKVTSGYYQYHAVPGNLSSASTFPLAVALGVVARVIAPQPAQPGLHGPAQPDHGPLDSSRSRSPSLSYAAL
jgi:hypothetical protein